jgi:hypothetical protein
MRTIDRRPRGIACNALGVGGVLTRLRLRACRLPSGSRWVGLNQPTPNLNL